MKKMIPLLLLILLTGIFIACNAPGLSETPAVRSSPTALSNSTPSASPSPTPDPSPSPSELEDFKLTITINQGSGWEFETDVITGSLITILPTHVLWAENGENVKTLFATEKLGTGKLEERTGPVPVWGRRYGIKNSFDVYMPEKTNPLPDGISSSTPVLNTNSEDYHTVSYTMEPPLSSFDAESPLDIYLEINHSFDSNDYYQGDSAHNGQPSLIYHTQVDLSSLQSSYTMTLIGTGAPEGNNGEIYGDTSELTTALTIVESINIEVIKVF